MDKREEYKMDPVILEKFTSKTNRSKGQTQFLYNMVDGDFSKLVELEEKLKNNHINYCPGDKESVKEILKLGNGGFKININDFF